MLTLPTAQPAWADATIGDAGPVETGALSLSEAVSISRSRSGELEALRASQRASDTLAGSLFALPDPVVSIGIANLPINGPSGFAFGEQLATAFTLGVSQALVARDKREARQGRETQQAALYEAQHALTGTQLAQASAQAWMQRAVGERLRRFQQQQLISAQQILEAAQAQYRGGSSPTTQVFDARIEIERVRDAIDETERELALANQALRRWLGDAADRPLAEPPVLDVTELGRLRRQALPALMLARAQSALADSHTRLAVTQADSDWTVSMTYGRRGSRFGDAISITLQKPWRLNRDTVQDQVIAARTAMADASRARAVDIEREQKARIDAQLDSLGYLLKRIERYRERLLPMADQRAQASLVAYSGGTSGLAGVLANRRALDDLRVAQARLERQASSLWAELAFADPVPAINLPDKQAQP